MAFNAEEFVRKIAKKKEQQIADDIARRKAQQELAPVSTTSTNDITRKIIAPTVEIPTKTTETAEIPTKTNKFNGLQTPQELKSQENIKKQQENVKLGQEKEKSKGISLFNALLEGQKVARGNTNAAATTANSLKLFGQGMMKAEEGIFIDAPLGLASTYTDISSKLISGATGLFNKEKAQQFKEQGQSISKGFADMASQDWTSNALDYYGWNKTLDNGKTVAQTLEDNSVIKESNLGGKVIEGIGGMAPTILMGALIPGATEGLNPAQVQKIQNLVSYGSLGTRSYGNGFEEAIQNGGTVQEANAYGLLNAATEIGTEWMSGGIPGIKGSSGLDGAFGKYVLKEGIEDTSKSLSKAIIKGLYKTGMEGVEEMVSEMISPFIKQFTYQYDKDKGVKGNLKEAANNLSFTDIVQAGIIGALTGAVLDGGEIASDIKASTQVDNTIDTIAKENNIELTNEQKEKVKQELNTEDLSKVSNELENISNEEETLENKVENGVKNENIAPIQEQLENQATQDEIAPIKEQTDIAPINDKYKAITEKQANDYADELQQDENYWKQQEDLIEQAEASDFDSKTSKKLVENIGNELGLKGKQKQDLQGIIEKAYNEDYTLEELENELYKQYAHDSVTTKRDDIIDMQKILRDYRIKVSPEIQRDISDYGYWKQKHFGKLKLTSDGVPVDVVYGELSDKYPGFFPEDIWNPSDQLQRIAEVADMDKYYTEEYELPEETIHDLATYIHDTFMENKYANAMKADEELEKIAMQYNENLGEVPEKKKTRKEVRGTLQEEMGLTPLLIANGKDISNVGYELTTPERVNEKVFGREIGKTINNETVYFAKHQEAERIRFLNKERQEIQDLGIKARSKESELVQKYGEGLIDDVQLEQQAKNKESAEKIKNAARVLRGKYDTYLDLINEQLVNMGYDPIPKRKDYMRHFQELTDKFSQAGIPFNRQSMNSENLPTDINGLTEFNAPGKNWFASAKQRTGNKTTYDAITGIDGYLEGASNLMYHTETIQRYRALEQFIRDTYGAEHGLDEFGEDLSSEEAMQRLQDIQEGKLSNYVAWLHEQANAIAGKKGALDRGIERFLGRKAYAFLNTLKKQTGSNMTGYNVRSALTNFISSTIAASKTNKVAMAKGTIDTVKNIFHKDNFINESDFLTSRFGSDSISKKTWEKVSNAGQIFMSGSDWFTANLITRSKYYEGLQKGMTHKQAMKYADDFGARVMGDRSKGATAEAFNSKTLGLLTQFQLETNNQWQYMLHDTKMEYAENKADKGGLKAGATMLWQMGQLSAYSYFFNELFEKLTGSRAAFDPADIFKKIFGLDDEDKDKDFETRLKEATSELLDSLPFSSLFGSGGRLPIGEMLTPLGTAYDALSGNTNKYGQEVTWKDVRKDLKETLPYYVLPTGYGQLKKTIGGLEMYDENLPTPGSYTDSGNLRFTADTDTGSVIKNALFGKWSSEEAKKYRESGYKTIQAKDVQEMKDLDMNSSEYREYKNGLKDAGTKNSEKIDYIGDLDVPISKKNIMAKNVLKRDVDMSDYNKYGSYEEFDYAYKNPTKYKTITAITDYDKYQEYTNKIKEIKNNTTNDKQETIKYINSLDLTIPQKAMFIRQYYKTYNNYNNEIVKYVNSLDISKTDKQDILKELNFKTNGNKVSW